jgi:hypothetical protein
LNLTVAKRERTPQAERKIVMDHIKRILTRASVVVGLLVLAVAVFAVMNTKGQATNQTGSGATEQWEYLALAGPVSGLTPANKEPIRKEPSGSFGREAISLEQHLDKLGANGWELIAVAGPPTDPAYYFKRRK